MVTDCYNRVITYKTGWEEPKPMKYYISRGGQQFGPYTMADLRNYVAQGNILLTDLACGEGQTQWVPVSQLMGGSPAPPQQVPPQSAAPQPVYQQPVYSAPQPVGPGQPAPVYQMGVGGGELPPGLHWVLVLLIGCVTCGLFTIVWLFIQASFVKKIRPASNAILLYAIGLAAPFAAIVVIPFAMRSMGVLPLAWVLQLGGVVLIIMGHFNMKSAIEEYYNTVEPINLRLSGVMVFFFSVYYF